MNTLYKDILLDHYRNPRNKGMIIQPDFSCKEYIPSCGDSISVQGNIKENRIEKIVFEGAGCVISQATASMLTQSVLGKTIDEILALSAEDILHMIGMSLGPLRLKCALLSLHAIQGSLKKL